MQTCWVFVSFRMEINPGLYRRLNHQIAEQRQWRRPCRNWLQAPLHWSLQPVPTSSLTRLYLSAWMPTPEFDDAVQSCVAQRQGPALTGQGTASSSKMQLIRYISDRIKSSLSSLPRGRIEKTLIFLSQNGKHENRLA